MDTAMTAENNPGALPVDAHPAWDALSAALDRYRPPCAGVALFTADGLKPAQRAECKAICDGCLVSDLCEDFAVAAKVPAGFWAGRAHTPKGRHA
ncbi:WhiB family transcriptional regulator [Microbacterium sp. JZ70]